MSTAVHCRMFMHFNTSCYRAENASSFWWGRAVKNKDK